jgi:hypothetical protein
VFWEAPPIGTPTVFAGSGATGNNTAYTVTTTAAIAANNLAIVAIIDQVAVAGTSGITAISDGTNSYTRGVSAGTTSNHFELWYKLNATAVASSATITATCGALCSATAKAYIVGIQVSNITALDVTTGASACTSLTTTALAQVNDLTIGMVGGEGGAVGTYSPPAQYSNLIYSGAGTTFPGIAVDTLSNINLTNKNGQTYIPSVSVFLGTTGCVSATFKGN